MQFAESSTDAEGYAIPQALNWAKDAWWERCMFETDCGVAFSLIFQGGKSFSPSSGWVKDCAELLVAHKDWSLSLVRREANNIADMLAKKAASEEWSWSNNVAVLVPL